MIEIEQQKDSKNGLLLLLSVIDKVKDWDLSFL